MLVAVLIVATACSNGGDVVDSTTVATTVPSTEMTTEAPTTEVSTTAEATTAAPTSAASPDDLDDTFYPMKDFVVGVSDYVTTLDPSELYGFSNFSYTLTDDYAINSRTGQLKQFYTSDEVPQVARIRIPQLTENSELAAKVNREIVDFFAAFDVVDLYFLDIDYDAYIYNDVLSIKLFQDVYYAESDIGQKEVIKTYNFDIADGELKLLSSAEMLDRINVSPEGVKEFAYEFLADQLYVFCQTEEAINNMEIDIEDALLLFDENLANDQLMIYKKDYDNYYGLCLGYMFYDGALETKQMSFTLAETPFQMALLTHPENAIGVIYKANDDQQQLPEGGESGEPFALRTINDPSAGSPVYIASFDQVDDDIDICDLELLHEDGEDTFIYVEKTTSKQLDILNRPHIGNVYLYYTQLPEIMPTEAVVMKGRHIDGYEVTSDAYIYSDMRFGSSVQYVYGDAPVGRFKDDEDLNVTLELKYDRSFTASGDGDFWNDYGMPMQTGHYTSDEFYIFLFPDDIAADDEDVYYVFEKANGDTLIPVFSNAGGWIDGNLALYLQYE